MQEKDNDWLPHPPFTVRDIRRWLFANQQYGIDHSAGLQAVRHGELASIVQIDRPTPVVSSAGAFRRRRSRSEFEETRQSAEPLERIPRTDPLNYLIDRAYRG